MLGKKEKDEARVRINVNLSFEIHRALKIYCAKEGISIQELVEKWVADKVMEKPQGI